MRPDLDRDPATPHRTELLEQSFLGRGQAALSHPIAFQLAIAAGPVAQVHPDRDRLRNSSTSPRTLSSSDILLHGRSPFAPRVRIHWERIASHRGPAFSSHLGKTSRASIR